MKAITRSKAASSEARDLSGYRSPISSPGLSEARWFIEHAPTREFSLAPRAANAKALAIASRHFEKALQCGEVTSSAALVWKDSGRFSSAYHGVFKCLTSSCLLEPCKVARAKVDSKAIRKHIDVDLPDIYDRCRSRRGKRKRTLALIVIGAPPDPSLSLREHADLVESALEALMAHETWHDVVAGGYWRLQVEFPRNVHYNLLVEVKAQRRVERELRTIWNTLVKGYGKFSFDVQWVEDWDTYEELSEHVDRITGYVTLPDDKARSLVPAHKGQNMPSQQEVLAATVCRRRVGWFGEWFNSARRQQQRVARKQHRHEIIVGATAEFKRRASRCKPRERERLLKQMVAEHVAAKRELRRARKSRTPIKAALTPDTVRLLLVALQDIEERPVPPALVERYSRELLARYHRGKECPVDIEEGSLVVQANAPKSTRAVWATSVQTLVMGLALVLKGKPVLSRMGLPRWLRRRVVRAGSAGWETVSRARRFVAATANVMARHFGSTGSPGVRVVAAVAHRLPSTQRIIENTQHSIHFRLCLQRVLQHRLRASY